MPFRKIAQVSIIATGDFSTGRGPRVAARTGKVSYFSRVGLRINLSEVLDRVYDLYDISPDPTNYGLVACRAVTVEVPNENGDAFPRDELLRFEPSFGRRVYRSFEYRPLCQNHKSDNPKWARGVLVDAHWNDDNPKDEFIETLVAFDKLKDPMLARGIKTGSIDGFSMGCDCGYTVCSVPGCENVAYSRSDFCEHIKNQKMAKDRKTGAQIFERCFEVCFQELSSVGDPADPFARTTELLVASRRLSDDDKRTAMLFAQQNSDLLPEQVLRAIKLGAS